MWEHFTSNFLIFIVAFLLTWICLFLAVSMFINTEKIDTLFIVSLIAFSLSVIFVLFLIYGQVEHIKRSEDVLKEVVDLLNVEKEMVSHSTFGNSDYDYSVKVGNKLYGIDYDFDNREIVYIILGTDYIFEREGE